MRRDTTILLFLALAAALTAACGGAEPPPASAAERQAVHARLARAERAVVPEEVALRGTVEAVRTATVSTRVMGTVTRVPFEVGQRVARGDLLVAIDPATPQGQLDQARGALLQAEAAHALAEKSFRRFDALAARDAASPAEVDQARAQLDQAAAAVAQARGAVAAAASMAGDASVRAPFAGRVVSRMVEPGDLAAPGRPLVAIEADGERRLVVAVPESLQARLALAPGAPVAVGLDARPELGRLAGTVAEVSPGADRGSRSFEIEISLPLADVATGTAGRAWLTAAERSAVVVPRGAVLDQGGLEIVVLRGDDGTTTTRLVRTGAVLAGGGAEGGARIEILSGLAGGETVLVGLGAVPPAGSPVSEVPR